MTSFVFVQGQTYEDLQFTIKNGITGLAIDISTATITFRMSLPNLAVNKVESVCTITDGPNGVCEYRPVAADLDTAEKYVGELEVNFGGGNVGYIQDITINVIPIVPTT